ncbi:hypothetical protein F5144DRAFT_8725 [Chaetomium tenue]|uniref:Uncharacterized protein n=1 Tax=Chaetomium tenue TaxID=1854479 RepID=A0ACB7PKE2_9PEZI|nr:hypothetical protein F5144DRAFT_8725 [Chaetomium globosum]
MKGAGGHNRRNGPQADCIGLLSFLLFVFSSVSYGLIFTTDASRYLDICLYEVLKLQLGSCSSPLSNTTTVRASMFRDHPQCIVSIRHNNAFLSFPAFI